MDRELTLKDKAIELLQRQLRAEQEARREETRHGITFAECADRLIKAQTDLTHTKAILDLQNHRIAAAMHQVCRRSPVRPCLHHASDSGSRNAIGLTVLSVSLGFLFHLLLWWHQHLLNTDITTTTTTHKPKPQTYTRTCSLPHVLACSLTHSLAHVSA